MKIALYVDKPGPEAMEVSAFLDKHLDLWCRLHAEFWHIGKTLEEDRKQGQPLDVLIVPVPMDPMLDPGDYIHLPRMDFYRRLYSKSLHFLRRLKADQPGLVVIGYTGADDDPEVAQLFKEEGNLDAVVFKHGHARDIPALEAVLRQFSLFTEGEVAPEAPAP